MIPDFFIPIYLYICIKFVWIFLSISSGIACTYIYIYIRMLSYLIFFDETHERSPLYLDRLSVSIVKSDHEMEEVTFSQITRWLFFEVCPADADPEI